jgi:putative transposase
LTWPWAIRWLGARFTILMPAPQYTAVHLGETLTLAGLNPSIGTVGDALDNALAETTIGLYKTECVREDSPFDTGH